MSKYLVIFMVLVGLIGASDADAIKAPLEALITPSDEQIEISLKRYLRSDVFIYVNNELNSIIHSNESPKKVIEWHNGPIVNDRSYFICVKMLKLPYTQICKTIVPKLNPLFKQITSKIVSPGDTAYNKVLKIHDYVASHVSYNNDDWEKVRKDWNNFTAMGAFKTKKAVCQGYTELFGKLLRAEKIDNLYVHGQAGGTAFVKGNDPIGHVWSKVKVDGKWYNVDVTWVDTLRD